MGFKRLQDSDGNDSSKRMLAAILITSAIILAFVCSGRALFYKLGDAAFLKDVIYTFVGGACVCISATAFEGWKKVWRMGKETKRKAPKAKVEIQ